MNIDSFFATVRSGGFNHAKEIIAYRGINDRSFKPNLKSFLCEFTSASAVASPSKESTLCQEQPKNFSEKCAPRPGDANLDGRVDETDFKIWHQNKFSKGGWCQGDFNGDGLVDGSDFSIWNQYKFS